MNYEGLLWLGLIMASPLIYMLSKALFTFLLVTFSKTEKVTITVDDGDGHRVKKVLHLDKSDDLLTLLDEIKKGKKVKKRAKCL